MSGPPRAPLRAPATTMSPATAATAHRPSATTRSSDAPAAISSVPMNVVATTTPITAAITVRYAW